MSEIRAIISDLDGTLVDTFEANFAAYHQVFGTYGICLSREMYKEAFGLRITDLLRCLGLDLNVEEIKCAKAACYPDFFDRLRPNNILIQFLRAFHQQGGKTALASTASKANVNRVLQYINAEDIFDICITGEEVKHGKPNPECYIAACTRLGIKAEEALIFEDSPIGMEAAQQAGIRAVKVGEKFYAN